MGVPIDKDYMMFTLSDPMNNHLTLLVSEGFKAEIQSYSSAFLSQEAEMVTLQVRVVRCSPSPS